MARIDDYAERPFVGELPRANEATADLAAADPGGAGAVVIDDSKARVMAKMSQI